MTEEKQKRVERLASLLAGHILQQLTPEETEELHEWIGASEKNQRLFNELTDPARLKLALALLIEE